MGTYHNTYEGVHLVELSEFYQSVGLKITPEPMLGVELTLRPV